MSENYISHTNSDRSFFDRVYQVVRNRALRSKERLLSEYVSKKETPFVDYGAGTGHFVKQLVNNNWNCIGIEISEEARSQANSNIQDRMFGLDKLGDINKESLSGFSMWHVLEHIYEPQVLLETFHTLMNPEAVGFIAVPNIESYDSKYYGNYWAALDVPLHFSHYTKKSMQSLVDRSGFEIVKVINMPFDSYYISLISEQNKESNRIMGMIRASVIGALSNLKATKSKNASSLIYVIKKK
jgi:2-polyprenyl-3-methyl-5-hydroxy-6-metoxy-1,4-benzoquinol methylase